MRFPKRIAYSVVLAIIICGFYVGYSVYAANRLTQAIPSRIDTSPKFVSNDFEDVTFRSQDGVELSGWFFKAKGERAVIFVSGLTQNRVNNGYFTLFIAHDLYEKGYSVLLYDSRGEGQSQKVRLGFGGPRDGSDVVGSVRFLEKRGFDPKKIGIIGDSVGAITLVENAQRLSGVGALVVDSPAARFAPVVANILVHDYHISKIFDPGIFFFAKNLFGVDIEAVNPIDEIQKVPERKFLILHGANDNVIPAEDGKQLIKRAGQGSKLVIFENAFHVETYKSDPDLYRKEVFGFLDSELK